jgi:fatty acid kinase fatty acid binding subunit
MKRLIVTDSTADIPEDLTKQLGIKVLPVNVVLDGKKYKDGLEITRDQFYQNFHRFQTMATEAVPHEDYALEYLQWIQYYDEILIIHCSRHLSETYTIAANVNAEFGDPRKCRVEVIDSGLCSMSLGMVVIAAAKALQRGKSLQEVLDVVSGVQRKMKSYLAIPTLKYLKKNKKISGFKSVFGLALGVKPVLEFNDGRMEIKTKLFGKQKNMILAMMDNIKRDIGLNAIDLSIIYSGEIELVERLRNVFQSTFDCRDIYIARFGPSIAINAGPESYAVFFSTR